MNKNLFKDKLENNEFIYTSEVSPERGTDLSKIKIILKSLKDKITAFNVTDNQGANINIIVIKRF